MNTPGAAPTTNRRSPRTLTRSTSAAVATIVNTISVSGTVRHTTNTRTKQRSQPRCEPREYRRSRATRAGRPHDGERRGPGLHRDCDELRLTEDGGRDERRGITRCTEELRWPVERKRAPRQQRLRVAQTAVRVDLPEAACRVGQHRGSRRTRRGPHPRRGATMPREEFYSPHLGGTGRATFIG